MPDSSTMPGSTKRRGYTPDSDAGNRSLPRPRLASPAPRLDQPNPVAVAFARSMKIRKNTELKALNAHFRAFVNSIVIVPGEYHSVQLLQRALDEYLIRSRRIESKYGGVPCQVVGMGNDDINQLGITFDGSGKPANRPRLIALSYFDVKQVSAGGLHSVLLCMDGIPCSWGNGDDGTLGRDVAKDDHTDCGTPKPITGFKVSDRSEDGTIIQVATGSSHILYLTAAGNVHQSGMYKDMDSGTYSDPSGPDNKSCLKANERPVHVQGLKDIVDIACGGCFNAAIGTSGELYTWGFGNSGELARSAGMTTPDADGKYDLGQKFFYKTNVGDDNIKQDLAKVKDHFLTPKPVLWDAALFGRVVTKVSCASYHIMVAARDPGQAQSKLYTSGLNQYGQLGHGDQENRHSLTLVEELKDVNFAYLAAGEHFSLALASDGVFLYAFGRGDKGQLGVGFIDTGDQRSTPVVVAFPEPVVLADIQAGESHALALTDKHEVYTWGYNGDVGATGHPAIEDEDVYRPKLLNLDSVGGRANEVVRVHGISGGGQHSLLNIKRHTARAAP